MGAGACVAAAIRPLIMVHARAVHTVHSTVSTPVMHLCVRATPPPAWTTATRSARATQSRVATATAAHPCRNLLTINNLSCSRQ